MDQHESKILAQLPQALLNTDGNVQFGPCYGLAGLRKRKRLEVAVAIDGETLNLYDVQSARHITSYAVHLDTIFTCPPSSIRCRLDPSAPAGRYTVCAVEGPERNIRCIQETSDKEGNSSVTTLKYKIEDENPIIYVDFVPTSDAEDGPISIPDIIAVHQNGKIRRLTGDLEAEMWVSNSVPASESRATPPEVVYAQWISKPDASKGLLKNREDILQGYNEPEVSFLLLVYNSGDHLESGLNFGVFEIPCRKGALDSASSPEHSLRLLVTKQIPDVSGLFSHTDRQFHFNTAAAKLSISTTDKLVSYDLSAYSLEGISKIELDGGHSSLFPISDCLVAGVQTPLVMIYDTQVESIRANILLKGSKHKGKIPRKKLRFVSYFAKINSLVAVRGRHLLSIHVPGAKSRDGLSRPSGLLVDSLGCQAIKPADIGSRAHAHMDNGVSRVLFASNPSTEGRWKASMKKLNELSQQRKVEEFESLMIHELSLDSNSKETEEGASKTGPPKKQDFLDPRKVSFLVAKVLSPTAGDRTSIGHSAEVDLRLSFTPPRLLKWLMQSGYLMTFEVEQALASQFAHLARVRLRPGAVAQTFLKEDPTLVLLNEYLQGSNLSHLDEVIAVTKLLIDSSTVYPEGQESSGTELWQERATSALNRVLEILHGFPAPKVASSVRTQMDAEQQRFLIQHLRHQLFLSGSLSTSSDPALEGKLPYLEPATSVSLLCSCMDALGPVTFFGSSIHGEIWEDVIPDLKTEISLALGGVEEATYLKGILREMVRYGNDMNNKDLVPTKSAVAGSKGGANGQALSMQPLGSRGMNNVSRLKRRKGGGEVTARSGREIHHLASRNVPSYSFERLVI